MTILRGRAPTRLSPKFLVLGAMFVAGLAIAVAVGMFAWPHSDSVEAAKPTLAITHHEFHKKDVCTLTSHAIWSGPNFRNREGKYRFFLTNVTDGTLVVGPLTPIPKGTLNDDVTSDWGTQPDGKSYYSVFTLYFVKGKDGSGIGSLLSSGSDILTCGTP